MSSVSGTVDGAIATSASFGTVTIGIAHLVKTRRDIDVLGGFHERFDIRRYLGR